MRKMVASHARILRQIARAEKDNIFSSLLRVAYSQSS